MRKRTSSSVSAPRRPSGRPGSRGTPSPKRLLDEQAYESRDRTPSDHGVTPVANLRAINKDARLRWSLLQQSADVSISRTCMAFGAVRGGVRRTRRVCQVIEMLQAAVEDSRESRRQKEEENQQEERAVVEDTDTTDASWNELFGEITEIFRGLGDDDNNDDDDCASTVMTEELLAQLSNSDLWQREKVTTLTTELQAKLYLLLNKCASELEKLLNVSGTIGANAVEALRLIRLFQEHLERPDDPDVLASLSSEAQSQFICASSSMLTVPGMSHGASARSCSKSTAASESDLCGQRWQDFDTEQDVELVEIKHHGGNGMVSSSDFTLKKATPANLQAHQIVLGSNMRGIVDSLGCDASSSDSGEAPNQTLTDRSDCPLIPVSGESACGANFCNDSLRAKGNSLARSHLDHVEGYKSNFGHDCAQPIASRVVTSPSAQGSSSRDDMCSADLASSAGDWTPTSAYRCTSSASSTGCSPSGSVRLPPLPSSARTPLPPSWSPAPSRTPPPTARTLWRADSPQSPGGWPVPRRVDSKKADAWRLGDRYEGRHCPADVEDVLMKRRLAKSSKRVRAYSLAHSSVRPPKPFGCV